MVRGLLAAWRIQLRTPGHGRPAIPFCTARGQITIHFVPTLHLPALRQLRVLEASAVGISHALGTPRCPARVRACAGPHTSSTERLGSPDSGCPTSVLLHGNTPVRTRPPTGARTPAHAAHIITCAPGGGRNLHARRKRRVQRMVWEYSWRKRTSWRGRCATHGTRGKRGRGLRDGDRLLFARAALSKSQDAYVREHPMHAGARALEERGVALSSSVVAIGLPSTGFGRAVAVQGVRCKIWPTRGRRVACPPLETSMDRMLAFTSSSILSFERWWT
ncbi:hypothetical protein BC628DRAFT_512497 [Trametes gibbosa]|nr:hypothetical protein BC628DRAFT_512497 [Trametes gibbosa]